MARVVARAVARAEARLVARDVAVVVAVARCVFLEIFGLDMNLYQTFFILIVTIIIIIRL